MRKLDNSHNGFNGNDLKPDRGNIIMRRWFVVLAILMALVIALFTGGCEVFKFRKEDNKDTTSVNKGIIASSDTSSKGSVKTEEGKVKETADWWRVIQQFPRDTNITNNNYYPQPATVIYEGGNATKESEYKNTDSSWQVDMRNFMLQWSDSMNAKIERIEKTKHSETKGIGTTIIMLVIVGLFVLSKGYNLWKSNYQIIKKQKV